MTGWGALGIVVGMLGVVLLFGLDLSGDAGTLAGGLMVLLASLGYAVGAILLRHKVHGVEPVAAAGANMAIAAVVTLPLFLATLPDQAPSAKAVGSLVVLGAGGTGIAFLWFYTLIRDLGPARAAVVAYIAPGFSVLYGTTLLGEPLTAGAIGGLALILAGSWLAVQGPPARPPTHSPARRLASAEAHLPVRARPRLRALDEVKPLGRRAEEARDQPQAGVLGAQVEQPLLGVEAEVHGRGHLVGGHRVELVVLERAVGRLPDELAVGGVRRLGGRLVGRLVLVGQQLHRARRVGEVVALVDDAKRPRPAREDVQPPVLHALEGPSAISIAHPTERTPSSPAQTMPNSVPRSRHSPIIVR